MLISACPRARGCDAYAAVVCRTSRRREVVYTTPGLKPVSSVVCRMSRRREVVYTTLHVHSLDCSEEQGKPPRPVVRRAIWPTLARQHRRERARQRQASAEERRLPRHPLGGGFHARETPPPLLGRLPRRARSDWEQNYARTAKSIRSGLRWSSPTFDAGTARGMPSQGC